MGDIKLCDMDDVNILTKPVRMNTMSAKIQIQMPSDIDSSSTATAGLVSIVCMHHAP